MSLRIKQFSTLTGMTAAEIIRQPICLILTSCSIMLATLMPVMIMHQLGEEGKLVRDSSLAFHFLFGMLISAFAASRALSSEMRSGTAAAILSKPVSRPVFYLAKFTGVLAAASLFSLCASMATILSSGLHVSRYEINWTAVGFQLAVPAGAMLIGAAMNFRHKKIFTATAWSSMTILLAITIAVRLVINGPDFADWRLIPASLLITMALFVMSSITLTLATRLHIVPTITAAAIIFVLGLVSHYYFGRFADSQAIAAVLYTMIPNWHHFWLSDLLNGEGVIPYSYVAHTALYATTYTLGMTGLGMLIFRKREIC